ELLSSEALRIMEGKNAEISILREKLLKKGSDLESFRIYTTRLENELANSKEMLRSSRDEKEDLLTSLIALNGRVDKLVEINQQLEYEKDLSSRMIGLKESDETVEQLQLRVLKAETSSMAAKMSAE
ncbi:hypothetical protein PMAYCL1PPCAC_25922, partial [Pristionchus mayeri]